MKTTTTRIVIALAVIIVSIAIGINYSQAPRWLEASPNAVYECVGIDRENGLGMCINIDNTQDVYETNYRPSFIGGEYFTFYIGGGLIE